MASRDDLSSDSSEAEKGDPKDQQPRRLRQSKAVASSLGNSNCYQKQGANGQQNTSYSHCSITQQNDDQREAPVVSARYVNRVTFERRVITIYIVWVEWFPSQSSKHNHKLSVEFGRGSDKNAEARTTRRPTRQYFRASA